MRVGLAGRETAIGDAIGLGVKRLHAQPNDQRVLILLTDGVNTAGALDPGKAAELARDAGVRIRAGCGVFSNRSHAASGTTSIAAAKATATRPRVTARCPGSASEAVSAPMRASTASGSGSVRLSARLAPSCQSSTKTISEAMRSRRSSRPASAPGGAAAAGA